MTTKMIVPAKRDGHFWVVSFYTTTVLLAIGSGLLAWVIDPILRLTGFWVGVFQTITGQSDWNDVVPYCRSTGLGTTLFVLLLLVVMLIPIVYMYAGIQFGIIVILWGIINLILGKRSDTLIIGLAMFVGGIFSFFLLELMYPAVHAMYTC